MNPYREKLEMIGRSFLELEEQFAPYTEQGEYDEDSYVAMQGKDTGFDQELMERVEKMLYGNQISENM